MQPHDKQTPADRMEGEIGTDLGGAEQAGGVTEDGNDDQEGDVSEAGQADQV